MPIYTFDDLQILPSIFEMQDESRMVSSGMLRRVALVITDVSEEPGASFIRVTRIVAPSSQILVTLMKEALCFSETSDLTRAARRNIPEDIIFHSHRRENLKS
jgi:hypothetical protein